MKLRLLILVSIALLALPVLACSLLRARQPFRWHITLEIDPSLPDPQAETARAVTTLESRLDAFGLSNFEVKALEQGRIRISLPSVSDRERLKTLLSAQGRLEISHVISSPNPAPIQVYATREDAVASLGGNVPPNRRVLPYSESDGGKQSAPQQRWVVVDATPIVAGNDLRTASAIESSGSDTYSIAFSLKPEGADRFGAWTGANINEYLAVIYNDEIKSIAYIRSQISDQGEISGHFSKQSAEDVALILKSGSLPKVKIVDEGNN